jgi:preprotein translocase subunit SecY
MGGGSRKPDKSLRLGLLETMRLAWADEDIRQRLGFMLKIFALFAAGIHIPVPIPGLDPDKLAALLEGNQALNLINSLGGGAFKKISIFALGMGPYITSSIIMMILTQTTPAWKQEMKEGGEYARRQQNKRTRSLTLVLCLVQGFTLAQGLLHTLGGGANLFTIATIVIIWSTGAFFVLWMGEQISEKGIGNGMSLMIFAGIAISFPNIITMINSAMANGSLTWWQLLIIVTMLLSTVWLIVFFSTAQRRIPIQHMKRNYGTKSMGGQTSYLPISVNMANVMPIIFAISLVYFPAQLAMFFPQGTPIHETLNLVASFFAPNFRDPKGYIGAVIYVGLIFGFTYIWIAMMYNVEDISDNLKRSGSYIPGVRPGRQTVEFLNGVISRVTFVGAAFLAVVALTQFAVPAISPGGSQAFGLIGGTSLLILVSVALETMRQIEANLLVKQYNG